MFVADGQGAVGTDSDGDGEDCDDPAAADRSSEGAAGRTNHHRRTEQRVTNTAGKKESGAELCALTPGRLHWFA